ncbi:SusC/RagA family TonB-linked outer membrane protein [Bacteroidota bacterium]
MKKFRIAIVLMIVVFNFIAVNAQQAIVIRGRVIDSEDRTTIIGATVVEYDQENRVVNGTITNVNGDFVYQMHDASNIVRISVIGYETQEIKIDPDVTIMVELVPEDIKIDEVQIIGQARSSGSLTNLDDRDKASSSVKIDMMDMKEAGVLSAADALQGKVSGLDIVAASGDPGSGSQLVIRGLSSMGNSQPLIVIDGIPQSKVSSDFDLSSADSEDISNLINIPLQDIKSIEVLKDAASTAAYGSEGADGVLLIESHKGRMGTVQFDYQYRLNLNIQPPPIPMLNGNEYIMLQMEEWHNALGVFEIPPQIAYDRDYYDFHNYSQNTDWVDAITQNGVSHDHYFSISGGAEKTRYFTSFSYLDEIGTTLNTGYSRFSTRVNLDYYLSRKLLFQVNFNYTSSTRLRNWEFKGWNEQTNKNEKVNIREMAYRKAPNMSIWELDENGNPTGEYFTPILSYQGDGKSYFNPVAVADLGKVNQNLNDFENTFLLRYKIIDWLTFKQTVTFQYSGLKSNSFLPYSAIGADWLDPEINIAEEANNVNRSFRTESQLSFGSPFKNKDHVLSGAFTWVMDQSGYERMSIESNKIPSTDIQDPAINALLDNTRIRTTTQEVRLLRSVNSINYKAFDRYMLQGVLTLDAHSSFGSNNRWGAFYGVSAGWRFSSEPFMSSMSKWLGESKLRVSYGLSGVQPKDPYARFGEFRSSGTGSYILNPSIEPISPQLNNLQWANVKQWDVGLELNLFGNRIYLEGDIYEKVTSDILFPRYEIPYSSGFNRLEYLNGGELTNVGWELMADFTIIRNRNWQWSVFFNTAQNTNTFDVLPENFNSESSTSIANGEYPKRVVEGEPIGSFFGFRYLGVWPRDEDVFARDADNNKIVDSEGIPIPLRYKNDYIFKGGDPIYKDLNNDGKIDINDVEYLGDSNPKFIGGFGTGLKYKSFSLNVAFHYRLGFVIVNQVAIQTEGMNDRNNQSKAVLYRWRKQGQQEEGMLPRAYMNNQASNLGSDRYVEQGDFFRLNNVTLAYRVPQEVCRKLRMRKLNVSVSGRKLLTFTQYSGQDPEVGQDADDPFWIGVDRAKTPPPKIITFSVQIGF